jgi:hypothetical protein
MDINILDALRITTEKIKEYINEKQVDVDTTLKVQGKAADAKAVGDAIANIKVPVTSVNGKTGDVVLTADDIGALSSDGILSTELITTSDIDEICGATIHTSSEVMF